MSSDKMTLAQAVEAVERGAQLSASGHLLESSIGCDLQAALPTLRAAVAEADATDLIIEEDTKMLEALRSELTESKQREQAIFETLERTREGRDMAGAELARVEAKAKALMDGQSRLFVSEGKLISDKATLAACVKSLNARVAPLMALYEAVEDYHAGESAMFDERTAVEDALIMDRKRLQDGAVSSPSPDAQHKETTDDK